MSQGTIQVVIPFESLINSLAGLSLQDKLCLWKWLGEHIAQVEEDSWEQDPALQAELREARAAYQAGDYVTIDEYLARQKSPENE